MIYRIEQLYKKYGSKWMFFKEQNTIYHLLFSYRYLSLIITSAFYFMGPPQSHILFKIGVSVSLYIAAIVIMNLYIKYRKINLLLQCIILTETLGIAILLFPTGGLDSPFIWYALNPVLIAASFSSIYFCWLNLIFYFGSFTLLAQNIYTANTQAIFSTTLDHSYIFLIFILITLIVQLFARLHNKLSLQTEKIIKQSKELEKMNNALKKSNSRVEESMNEIMSLYQVIETFSSKEDLQKLGEYFAEYAAKLTKSSRSFLFIKSEENEKRKVWMQGRRKSNEFEERLIENIEDYVNNQGNRESFQIQIMGQEWIIHSIQSPLKRYGFIGVSVEDKNDIKIQYARHLNFLSELLGVILERYRQHEVAEHLMLVEEQNRIADEIHDNVSQRLFSITYGTHALISKGRGKLSEKFMYQLENIYESSKLAMKELRATIYSLSSKKNGSESFFSMVEKYLQQLAQLNNIKIQVNMQGEEEQLSSQLRKAMYRLISEATGNAIKYSQCNGIKINLYMEQSKIILNIQDDGIGFDMEEVNFRSGLGIQNMKNITQSFDGVFYIISDEGQGTRIDIEIPTIQMNVITQGGIA